MRSHDPPQGRDGGEWLSCSQAPGETVCAWGELAGVVEVQPSWGRPGMGTSCWTLALHSETLFPGHSKDGLYTPSPER